MYDASHIKNRDVYKVYCDQNGVIHEGFIEYQDHTYYMSLSEDTGYLRGLHQINDKTYYFNYQYSDNEKKEMINYLRTNVIPIKKHEGTYFNKREGEGKYMEEAVDKLFKANR